jgi:hypothetical protein
MKKLLFLTISILIFISMVSCGDPPEKYKVIYHSDGSTSGFPPADNKEYKSGEYATVLGSGTMVNTGHIFYGWNTKADNSGDTYKENDKIQIKNINIFLFPVWK